MEVLQPFFDPIVPALSYYVKYIIPKRANNGEHMKVRTYLEFRALEGRFELLDDKVDAILVVVSALLDEGADREAAKALATDIKARTEALRNALPKA
ncbi:MAG: hypothetical protein ACRENK_15755 [Gemmatimonadaceae bacterium]